MDHLGFWHEFSTRYSNVAQDLGQSLLVGRDPLQVSVLLGNILDELKEEERFRRSLLPIEACATLTSNQLC